MELESSIEQYLAGLKESGARERIEIAGMVLQELQEYLGAESEVTSAEAIRAADLRGFLRDWYRQEAAVTPAAAARVVTEIIGFARWLDAQLAAPRSSSPAAGFFAARRPGEARPALAPALRSLEESLPRGAEAAALLRAHVRRDDLATDFLLDEEEGGRELGIVTGGATRVVRLDEVDYSRGEEDWFEVVERGAQSVSLLSPSRRQLGEGPAAPVRLPDAAAALLRIGDRLYAEIAPAGAEWELVNITTVDPGGWDDWP